MPTTLADIARRLGVSKMTVSRAINNHPEVSDETRKRILETAQKLNYRPNQYARALTTNRSYLFGIVVPDLMHSYFAEICRGVEEIGRPAGYQNLICNTDEELAKEMREIEALMPRTDGLIVASAMPPKEAKFYRRIIKEGANIVFIDRQLDGLNCPLVTTDDVQVGLIGTEHLISLGHRRVGHLKGASVSTGTGRYEGYKRALKKHKIPFDNSLVRACGFTEHDGYQAMKLWLEEGNVPHAVFAANDPAAIGAMRAITDNGLRVPEDIAIVGSGNIHYGDMLRVQLTTVEWSKNEMGDAAARLLIEIIEGNKQAMNQHVMVEPKLVLRESCGAAKAMTETAQTRA
jgi:LacI family transcriptional regulator